MSCLICDRIEMIKNGTNPYFVYEMETGYVVVGDFQRFKGYTLFLCKRHVSELHELPKEFRIKYLEEMSLIAEAVYQVFHPDKLNYELLGNGDSHVHWHIFPRRDGDTPKRGPVWQLSAEELYHNQYRPDKESLQHMTLTLREKLIQYIKED